MIVIGIGTGRCGTVSLGRLLNLQPDAHITHEKRPLLPWDMEDKKPIKVQLDDLRRRQKRFKFAGDVASAWLPYLPRLFREFTDIKVVGLWRDKEGFVESFMRQSGPRDNWTKGAEVVQPEFCKCFPKYEAKTKEENLGLYWEEYNATMFDWEKKGQVKTFPVDMLNAEESQDVLFDWLGMQDHRHRYGRHNANLRKDNRPDKL